MQKRSLFSRIFGSDQSTTSPSRSTEIKILNGEKAIFTHYKGDFENDGDVRACVDAIARNAAKMHPKHIRKTKEKVEILDDNLYKLVARKPNEIQNAYRFYYQVISNLEYYNNSLIYAQKDENLKITGLYPLEYSEVKFYEYLDKIWVKIKFGRSKERFVPYDDIIHLTRFVGKDGFFGGNTIPIVKTLSIKHVIDEGLVNAIKTTQSIRGVLKSTQAMLKPEDAKKMRDQFVEDFINSRNDSGIGAIDATTDFTPVKLEPTTATDSQVKSIDNKILNYFGISEKIVQSSYSEDEWNAFYESILEPISLQMSLEFSNKLFTPTEINFGNEIVFECNRLQYASNKTKIELIRYANNLLTIDEQREVLNLSPLPNGEGQKVLQDVNHMDSTIANQVQGGKEVTENDETSEEGN